MPLHPSLAIALDSPGTERREQAFELVKEDDKVTALRFLMPLKVESVLHENCWVLDEKKNMFSSFQLARHMETIGVTRGGFPEEPQPYLCFEIGYDAGMKPVSGKFTYTESQVHKMDFDQADRLLNKSFNPLACRLREFADFAYQATTGRADKKNALPAAGISTALSLQANIGLTQYMMTHDLPALSRPLGEDKRACPDRHPVRLETNPDVLRRGTAYARRVEQHVNMMQCLTHWKCDTTWLDAETCETWARIFTFHDARVAALEDKREQKKQVEKALRKMRGRNGKRRSSGPAF